jgi:hypothetical protein
MKFGNIIFLKNFLKLNGSSKKIKHDVGSKKSANKKCE